MSSSVHLRCLVQNANPVQPDGKLYVRHWKHYVPLATSPQSGDTAHSSARATGIGNGTCAQSIRYCSLPPGTGSPLKSLVKTTLCFSSYSNRVPAAVAQKVAVSASLASNT